VDEAWGTPSPSCGSTARPTGLPRWPGGLLAGGSSWGYSALAALWVPVAVIALLAAVLAPLLRRDRRGPLEWATGLSDYAVAPVKNRRLGDAPTAPDDSPGQARQSGHV